MTREPLESGPDGDVIILEKVFGFPCKKIFKAYEESTYFSYIPSGKPRRTHSIDARPVPWFTRSMDAAFLIVDHLRTKNIGVELTIYPDGKADCWALENLDETDATHFECTENINTADSVELAICVESPRCCCDGCAGAGVRRC